MFRLAFVLVAVFMVFGWVGAPAAHALSPLSSFGEFGAGPGQFDHPLGVGVADDGNVWVVDALNDRVQEWTAAGAFVRVFGSTGTGRGQFRLPEDVEVRGGYVYVSDCYGQRVQRFTAGSLAPAGEFTGGATRLKCPEGLAVGPGGEVYVADTFNDRVVVFDPSSGSVLRTFDGLPRPRDVAVSPVSGDVYVSVDADDQCAAARVARLSAAGGAVLGTFGTSGAGKLFCPLGVHVDAVGNVVVGDAAGRVNVYTPDGAFAMALTAPSGAKAFAYPLGIATDASCRVYVVERDAPRVRVYGWTDAPFCRALPAAAAGVVPPAVPTGDKVPPAVSVVWPSTVKLLRASTVRMKVRCPFERCRITSFGKVRVAGKVRWWMQITRAFSLKAGAQATVTLRFRRASDLRAVRRLLRRGRRPTLELVVSASDVKGNFARKWTVVTLR